MPKQPQDVSRTGAEPPVTGEHPDATTAAAPAPVTCLQCGGVMRPEGATDAKAIMQAGVESGAHPTKVGAFASKVMEKLDEFGRLYRCSHCGYMMRVKAAA